MKPASINYPSSTYVIKCMSPLARKRGLRRGACMNRYLHPLQYLILVALLGGIPASAALAEAPGAAVPVYADNWQLRRLMQPSEGELLREARGEVVIYDGLTDNQVESALSLHPRRIRSMMFVGTIITGDDGAPQMGDYGMFVLQDDGC